MNNQKVELRYDKNGDLSNMQNPESIKLILEEIKQGANPDDILKKYKIAKLNRLKEWQKKYGIIDPITPKLTLLSITTKRLLVHEILSKRMSVDEVIRQYKVSSVTIYLWLKKYHCEKDLNMDEQKATDEKVEPNLNQKLTEKKLIEELQLKILGLETMIDIAEEQFKIDIRKKSGTKQ